jgi:hypothetical protein
MATVALARDYPSIFAAPVLRSVSTEIFRLRYFMRCMACGFCADQCCSYGVDIDLDNANRLRALGSDFKAFVGVPEEEWFTGEVIVDGEFPSGAQTRTSVKDGRCVFHQKGGRGCKIHAYCLDKGLDYHLLKPMVSILFPLTFEHGALIASPEAVDGSLICSGDGPSLYDGVRDELAHYFGPELVAELDGLKMRL